MPQTRTTRPKAREPRTFRDVVERATTDAAYSRRMKSIALKAKSGKPADVEKFVTEFKLTPQALEALSPKGAGPVFLTSIPCTIVIATTFLSCFPRTSYGDHWFCKEAE